MINRIPFVEIASMADLEIVEGLHIVGVPFSEREAAFAEFEALIECTIAPTQNAHITTPPRSVHESLRTQQRQVSSLTPEFMSWEVAKFAETRESDLVIGLFARLYSERSPRIPEIRIDYLPRILTAGKRAGEQVITREISRNKSIIDNPYTEDGTSKSGGRAMTISIESRLTTGRNYNTKY